MNQHVSIAMTQKTHPLPLPKGGECEWNKYAP